MEYQRHQSPSPEQPAQGDNDTAATSAAEAPIAPAAVEPKLLTDAEQASEEAAELVEKLEYFKVSFYFEENFPFYPFMGDVKIFFFTFSQKMRPLPPPF